MFSCQMITGNRGSAHRGGWDSFFFFHGPEGKSLLSKNLIRESYKEKKKFHNNCLFEVN